MVVEIGSQWERRMPQAINEVHPAEAHLMRRRAAKLESTGASSLIPARGLRDSARSTANRGLNEWQDSIREEAPVLLVRFILP